MKMIRSLTLASLAFALTSSAWASENGNFRREEATRAAGADARDVRTRVVDFTRDAKPTPEHPAGNFRILFVEHAGKRATDGPKVDIVLAPVDKSQAVKKLTTKEANELGFQTQTQAAKLARDNGGDFGGKSGKVEIKRLGIGAKRGSYVFEQLGHAVRGKSFGEDIRATNIIRSVRVTLGDKESASASETIIEKKAN